MSLLRVFSGLRFRLLVLVILACAPLAALILHTAWDDRRRQERNWEQRAARLTELASREESELLGGTRQLLLALAESGPVRSANRRACKRLMDDLLASYPRYLNLGLINTNGELVASAIPVKAPNQQGEQLFFRRAVETRSFAVGNVVPGVGGGKPTIGFGHPVLDRSGQVQGVVFATLNLAWYDKFGSQIAGQVPRGATWTEITPDGTIVFRHPTPERWIGRELPEKHLRQVIVEQTHGATGWRDVQDIDRFYGFATRESSLAHGKAIGLLSIPKSTLFAAADRVLIRNLSWLGAAAALALALGFVASHLLIVKPLRTLVRSSIRVASGDFTARTGLRHGRDALGQLTLAFDRMAKALQDREEERSRASQKLQVLSHRLVEVQETERRHIARELHDEIGQSLTAAEMNLQAALQSPRSPGLHRRLTASMQAVEHVLEQVHDLSLNLRPSMLDDLGLEPALRWYARRQAELANLHLEFHGEPLEKRLDPVIETECFRVAQEALTNVVRHAKAKSVTVEIARLNGELHLSVRDDGAGFDVVAQHDEAVQGASLGLLSMEERATLAGGGLEISSSHEHGTEVHAWFPLRWLTEALPEPAHGTPRQIESNVPDA
jgi:signal transduction histidine kinase